MIQLYSYTGIHMQFKHTVHACLWGHQIVLEMGPKMNPLNLHFYNVHMYNLYSGNPSIMSTIGTSKLVLLMEVSFVEGSFNIHVIEYQLGQGKCPL